jgi:hypothetical protein
MKTPKRQLRSISLHPFTVDEVLTDLLKVKSVAKRKEVIRKTPKKK